MYISLLRLVTTVLIHGSFYGKTQKARLKMRISDAGTGLIAGIPKAFPDGKNFTYVII